MTDWVPIVFVAFKVLALGVAMFFAIKWHYDQGQRGRGERYYARAARWPQSSC
jgi:hypothetical protein